MLPMGRSTFWRGVSTGMPLPPVRIGGVSAETVVQVVQPKGRCRPSGVVW